MGVHSVSPARPVMTQSRWDRTLATLARLPLLGFLLCVLSAGMFGLCNVIVKKVEAVDPFTIAFYRFLGILLPSVSIVIYRQEDPFPKESRLLLIVRSVFGASNLLIIFYGLKHMPMADVNMISAGSPIWVVIFARIFLKEPLKVFDIINVFVTLLGILFIIRPPFIFGQDSSYEMDSQYYVAAAINFVGAILLQSNVYIILRKLKSLHFSVTLTVFGAVGALESFILMMTLGDGCVPQCGKDRYLMVAIGLISFVGQLLLTVSLKVEEAGKV